jgi:ZIP family zinc transporter
MLEAATWGLIAASSLVIGSILTFWLKPSRKLIGLIMGFGAGALISAIAYDLVEDAAASGRTLVLTAGLALGAITFFIGDWWVDRAGGAHRKRSSGEQAQGNSFGIFIGTLLDGIPESFILGASLVTGGGVSVAFLSAVFISNLPEAMGATTYHQHLAGGGGCVGGGGGNRLCVHGGDVARWCAGASLCGRRAADHAVRFNAARSA